MKFVVHFCILSMASSATADVQWFFGDRDGWFDAVGGPSNVTTIGFTEYPNGTTLTNHYSDLASPSRD